MMAGFSMLQSNAQVALNRYGIQAEAQNLTLGPLGLIGRVLNDPDGDRGGNSRKSTIKFIVGM